MSKKKNEPKGMTLFTCEGWSKKCNSVQPCQLIAPMSCRHIAGCPKERKSKWMRVPTTRLTV